VLYSRTSIAGASLPFAPVVLLVPRCYIRNCEVHASLIICPNCGTQQAGGDRCARCNSLFAYYEDHKDSGSAWHPIEGLPRTNKQERSETLDSVRDPKVLEKARRYYRVAQWATLGLILIVVVLILRKGTPPPAVTDPAAAVRAEEKIRDSEVAQSLGQPHKLQLDSTELNSYLNANLAIARTSAQETPAAAATSAPIASSTSTSGEAPTAPSAAASEQMPTLEEVQSSVRDVKVDMVGDVVKAYVVFNFHGQDISLELDGHIRADNGYLKFEPISGSIGSMPLPASTLQSVADRILDSPENRDKMKLPAGVSNIRIVNGQVLVDYK
jgi:hypothetical protein